MQLVQGVVCKCYPAPDRKILRHLHSSWYTPCRYKQGNELRTNVVSPILWLGNKTFAEGVRARNLEFVQHPRSGTHVQSLEAERVPAEVVDEIAEPT